MHSLATHLNFYIFLGAFLFLSLLLLTKSCMLQIQLGILYVNTKSIFQKIVSKNIQSPKGLLSHHAHKLKGLDNNEYAI